MKWVTNTWTYSMLDTTARYKLQTLVSKLVFLKNFVKSDISDIYTNTLNRSNYIITIIQGVPYISANTHPTQYRFSQLQYRFAVISEAPTICILSSKIYFLNYCVASTITVD